MLRYCFTTTDPGWRPKVRSLYSKLPVTITEYNNNEGCIESRYEEARKDIEGQNRYLGLVPRYTRPLPVPMWNDITENNGPYITENHYQQTIFNVKNKISNESKPITKRQELIIYSFLANFAFEGYHKDFAQNYNLFFLKTFESLPNDLDLSEFRQNTISLPTPSDVSKYKFAVVDGVSIELSVYTTPVTRVDDTGKIIEGVLEKDVILNSKKSSTYKTDFNPGAMWAYKWTINKETTYSKLLYPIASDDEDSDDDTASDASDASVFSQHDSDASFQEYGSDFDAESIKEEDIIVHENEGKWTYVAYDTGDDELDRLDSSILSQTELNLPLAYLKTKTQQWKIIHTCLVSNFRNHRYLSRVCDEVLNTVVDAIKYSIDSDNVVPNAAVSILQYHSKRNGKEYKHIYDALYNPNQ